MRRLNDDPITCEEDDILGRSRFVAGLASTLKKGSTAKSSKVILLDGDWGEGKTSVFNLLRKKIADDVDIVEFNVWGAAINESGVTEELLLLMANHCRMNVTSFSVKNYAHRSVNTNSIFVIISTFLGTGILKSYIQLDIVLTALMSEMGFLYLLIPVIAVCLGWEYVMQVILTIYQSFEYIFFNFSSSVSFKKKIAKKFLKLPRPLVVLIDDLDRLPSADLVRFFTAIKANLDFPNVTYFILGDRERIGKALSSGAEFESDFLGKIIQLTLSLPKSSKEQINKFMIEKLEEYLQEIGLSKEQKEITSLNRLLFYEVFWNLRDVKIFLSNLEIVIPMFILGDELEVNLWDLLVIELIRHQYPELYRQVYYSKREILQSPSEILNHLVERSGSKVPQNTLDFLETALSSRMAKEKGLGDQRYFDLYFQFSVPEYFTKSKVEEFLSLLSGELNELQIETLYKEILNRDLSFDDIERHVSYNTDLEINIGNFEIFKIAQRVLSEQANPIFAFNRFSGFFYWIIGTLDKESTSRYLDKSLEPNLRVLFIIFLFDNLTARSAITLNEYYTKELLLNYRDELIKIIAREGGLHKEFWYGRLFHLWFDYDKNTLKASILRIPRTEEDLVILFKQFAVTHVVSKHYRIKEQKSLDLYSLEKVLGSTEFRLLYEIAKPNLLAEGYSEFE